MDVANIRADLADEQQALDDVVAGLDEDAWRQATPSPRWSVGDQIAHLTYFDHTAAIAITDPERFSGLVTDLVGVSTPEQVDELTLGEYRTMESSELLEAWRTNRAELATASAGLANDDRVTWYGPSMGARSFLTARLMETWAHGQDVVDTVGGDRPVTNRLRHIAQLGFITRDWSYRVRGLEPSSTPVMVRLEGPGGDVWTFGPQEATQSIVGPAEDFCLVVTQRRHADDTGLAVDGDAAREWMTVAQIFAGGPTEGPSAGAFA